MLSLYKVSKSGAVKTRLRKGDIIGFDARRSSQAVKIFRPSKRSVALLIFAGRTGSPSINFRWQLDKEELEALAELMAASIGYNVNAIACSKLPVTWAYQVC